MAVPPAHAETRLSAGPRILVLRRDNIGDLACTTPLLDALRAQLPQAWIGAVATTYNAEVLARNPALDAVFAYEKLKHRTRPLFAYLRGRLQLAARLRKERLDYVLVPAPARQALQLARSFRPGQVIAADVSPAAGRHEVERTFELGRALGVRGSPGPMRVFPDPKVLTRLRGRVGAGPMLAVHLSARRPAQRWPFERYAALVRELGREAGVLLLWAPGARGDPRHPGDDDAAAQVAALAKGPNVVALPTPDLATLIGALSLAERVVCPDGGAMHLAAALGKPVIALFGDSPVERWRPWGVPHRVLRPDSGNLADLPLGPVLDACLELARPGEAENRRE
ncbi:MAG: glycosyltransferase family 9 protein [Burkholderiales bacterium]